MAASNERGPGALRWLEELPGIEDVVWTAVLRLAEQPGPVSVLFTAPEGRAGTSVLAAATAVGLAQHQRVPVCLLETHLQRPAQASYLGLAPAGLSDVLDGRAELEDVLQQPRDCPQLLVLAAGSARAPLAGEFTTERLGAVLAQLKARCRYLVLDAAPLLTHVESRVLLRHVDTALLVLRARGTLQSDAERAHDILVQSGTHVLGSIFNAYRSPGNARANRQYRRAVRAERVRPDLVPATPLAEEPRDARATPPEPALLQPGPEAGAAGNNGGLPHASTNGDGEAAHRLQIDTLERRIAKLTRVLEQTEAELRRIGALKNVDHGIASIYRGVQGLSPEAEALALKRSLMQRIFQANLELKTVRAQHP